jgi:hypothetical protein
MTRTRTGYQVGEPAIGQKGRGRVAIAGTLCLIVLLACGGGGSIGPPPEVSLAADQSWIFMGDNRITLTATVSASNGIESVKFFRVAPVAELLGSVDKPPYEWKTFVYQIYDNRRTVDNVFSSQACDQAGLCTDSNTVNVIGQWLCKYPPCE